MCNEVISWIYKLQAEKLQEKEHTVLLDSKSPSQGRSNGFVGLCTVATECTPPYSNSRKGRVRNNTNLYKNKFLLRQSGIRKREKFTTSGTKGKLCCGSAIVEWRDKLDEGGSIPYEVLKFPSLCGTCKHRFCK